MIAVGVDTHKERGDAVALDQLGQLLAELSFAATAAGYAVGRSIRAPARSSWRSGPSSFRPAGIESEGKLRFYDPAQLMRQKQHA